MLKVGTSTQKKKNANRKIPRRRVNPRCRRVATNTNASATQYTKAVSAILARCRKLAVEQGPLLLLVVVPPVMPGTKKTCDQNPMPARELLFDEHGRPIIPTETTPSTILGPAEPVDKQRRFTVFAHGNPEATVRILLGESNDHTPSDGIKFKPDFYTVKRYTSTPHRSGVAPQKRRERTCIDSNQWPYVPYTGKDGTSGHVTFDLRETEYPNFLHPYYMQQMGITVDDIREQYVQERIKLAQSMPAAAANLRSREAAAAAAAAASSTQELDDQNYAHYHPPQFLYNPSATHEDLEHDRPYHEAWSAPHGHLQQHQYEQNAYQTNAHYQQPQFGAVKNERSYHAPETTTDEHGMMVDDAPAVDTLQHLSDFNHDDYGEFTEKDERKLRRMLQSSLGEDSDDDSSGDDESESDGDDDEDDDEDDDYDEDDSSSSDTSDSECYE